jgi:hypothetical protein
MGWLKVNTGACCLLGTAMLHCVQYQGSKTSFVVYRSFSIANTANMNAPPLSTTHGDVWDSKGKISCINLGSIWR